MPIQDGKYVNPHWNNNAPPPLNASELNAISDTLENLDSKEFFENFKPGDVLITSRTDLDDTWTLANGEPTLGQGDIADLQYESWIPGFVVHETDETTQFNSSYNGFYDGENLYCPIALTNEISVVKRLPSGSEERIAVNSITGSCWLTPYEDGGLLYVNGIALFTYNVVNGSTNNTYVAYSSDYNNWENKLLFTVTSTSQILCSVQYINNEYVFIAKQPSGRMLYLLIAHGSLENVSSPKTLAIQSTTNSGVGHPSLIEYYDGYYYLLYSVNRGSGFYIYYEQSSTIDDMTITYNNDTDIDSSPNYILNSFPVGKFIIVLSENKVYGFNMETKETTQVDANISRTGQSIYFNDRYVFLASSYSSGTTTYNYACIIKAEDDIETILNIYDTSGDISYKFFGFGVLLDVPYLNGTAVRSRLFSTPTLPEVSVNNAYAYVKVSSS